MTWFDRFLFRLGTRGLILEPSQSAGVPLGGFPKLLAHERMEHGVAQRVEAQLKLLQLTLPPLGKKFKCPVPIQQIAEYAGVEGSEQPIAPPALKGTYQILDTYWWLWHVPTADNGTERLAVGLVGGRPINSTVDCGPDLDDQRAIVFTFLRVLDAMSMRAIERDQGWEIARIQR